MDGRGFRLKKLADTLSWTIPDGSGGRYTLKDNEVLFVYTPHEENPEYFAVLRNDNSIIGSMGVIAGIQAVLITPLWAMNTLTGSGSFLGSGNTRRVNNRNYCP